METKIQRALGDKVYERRKAGALELEQFVRARLAASDWETINKIIDQLCHDFAYATHLPYARNGGLIGLAAASIALGPEVIRYLEQIVPPVLACFGDQDARVRYYACESMYNIAKTSKGEILPYFNEVFDALSKLAADSEMSVKNGAELLDRLVKDIISDSATSYVSILHHPKEEDTMDHGSPMPPSHRPAAFSLPRLIPLLKERILVINTFTRMFLVQWITLLDSIPDLELVTYLPAFLRGLFSFLNDSNQDLVTATEHILERFLNEIKHVAKVKEELSQRRKERLDNASGSSAVGNESDAEAASSVSDEDERGRARAEVHEENGDGKQVDDGLDLKRGESAIADDGDSNDDGEASDVTKGEWIPGQDVEVDHPKILEILVKVLREIPQEHIQLTALRWIDSFFEICSPDILGFAPSLINQVLPALASNVGQVRQAGMRVNSTLMEYVLSLPDDETDGDNTGVTAKQVQSPAAQKSPEGRSVEGDQRDPTTTARANATVVQSMPKITADDSCCVEPSLDYEGCVNALTLQFLNEHEATRIATFSWLIMLQQKAPKRVLAAHDGTFPALLKTLSDPSDTVVTRDLQLLSQICQGSDDTFFTFFMVNLLKLFSTDRRLLENRGNMIIRQLCTSLSAERIYRTMAECLEKDEDVEFASTMVLYLNNNLITAPQLEDLRRKLRHWEPSSHTSTTTTKSNQAHTPQHPPLFTLLFRAWSHNFVATLSLCLLASAYEAAYHLITLFSDLEITLPTLIQLDKLINLLEAPVFTFLRLQLLEPAQHPYLYKTLYGLLMLLPQSAAFGYLKNRLNAVSPLGYLSIPQPPPPGRPGQPGSTTSTAGGSNAAHAPAFERTGRLKPRDESATPSLSPGHAAAGQQRVPWSELLDRFKAVQEKARRVRQGGAYAAERDRERERVETEEAAGGARKALPGVRGAGGGGGAGSRPASSGDLVGGMAAAGGGGPGSRIPALAGRWEERAQQGAGSGSTAAQTQGKDGKDTAGHKSRFSATQFGRSFVSHARNAGSFGAATGTAKGKEGQKK